jgi:hypothetical protein
MRTVAVEDTSEMHSVVLIDGKGQAKSGGRCPAGRTLAFLDTPQATFAAADAAWAYNHLLVSADKKEAQPVLQKPNDSRLKPSPLPWMNLPWRDLPNWATGLKPAPKKDPGGHGYCIPYNPVKYAYRTCGLVRGKHPYALIVDDVRKDDAEHDYTWLMQVPNDVTLKRSGPAKTDLILKESDGKRRLLVRILDGEGIAAAAKLEAYEAGRPGRPKIPYQRLVLPQRGIECRYRVLLFPFQEGEALPQTEFKGQAYSVRRGDQTDVFTLEPNGDGRTRLTSVRDGKILVKVP